MIFDIEVNLRILSVRKMIWESLFEDKTVEKKTVAHCDRNKVPIRDAMNSLFDELTMHDLTLLEIASGTGQHCTYLSQEVKAIGRWIPTDCDERCIRSIELHIQDEFVNNDEAKAKIAKPRLLNVVVQQVEEEEGWSPQINVVYAANLLHIAPIDVTRGLFRGASKALKPGGVLLIYGPFKVAGSFGAESNETFDKSLKSRNQEWGIRDVELLDEIGSKHALKRIKTINMPANNFLMVWQKD